MSSAFLAKLSCGAPLTDDDRRQILAVSQHPVAVPAGDDIIREGDTAEQMIVVTDGLACIYKELPEGRRSILGFMVPGDICDVNMRGHGGLDHSICVLSTAHVVRLTKDRVDALVRSPRIADAIEWANRTVITVLREWLVNVGRRPAEQQIAHLFCELFLRYQAVGRAQQQSIPLLTTQDELADALGLSAVHVNRVLQKLREDKLIVLQSKTLTIPDLSRLMAFAHFNGAYLQLAQWATQRGTVS